MKMVHVTSEAKASPIITALTRISADRNIDQGDSSRSVDAAGFSARLPPSAEGAVASGAAGAGTEGTAAGGAGAGDTVCAGFVGDGCCADSGCCADDGEASDSIASAAITA